MFLRTTVHALSLLLMLGLSRGSAQTAADFPPKTGRGASVSGAVVSHDGGLAISGAIVALSSPSVGEASKTITDKDGRFAFPGLVPGRYSVIAMRAGYVDPYLGSASSGSRGISVVIELGTELIDVVLRLAKGSVLSGNVSDEFGQPKPGVQIFASKYDFVVGSGDRVLRTVSRATTNARGEYRVFGLHAGQYFITASLSDRGSRQGDTTVDYAPVHFPGVTRLSDATATVVDVSEQRGGLDFSLTYVPTVTLRGTTSGLDGRPVSDAEVSVRIWDPAAGGGVLRAARSDSEGRFQLPRLSPDDYTVLAISRTRSHSGRSQITVGSGGSSMAILLRPNISLSGTMTFIGGSPRPSGGAPLLPSLVAVGNSPTGNTLGTVNADGSFSYVVAPGKYRVQARPLRSGWRLDAFRVNDTDVTDTIFDLTEQSSGLSITFSDRAADVSGRLLNIRDGRPTDYVLIMYPTAQDLRLPLSRRVKVSRPLPDSQFLIEDVPAGEYFVNVIRYVHGLDVTDTAFLAQLAVLGPLRLTIGVGQSVRVDLGVAGP